jgi:hypothetical protein
VRLAATCRVLFTESGGGKSLMQQLGTHKTITLPDTAILDKRAYGPIAAFTGFGKDAEGNRVELFNDNDPPGGLVVNNTSPDGRMRWTAPLDARMQGTSWSKLPKWLSTPAVRGSSGVTHSRSDFIRVLANQEGGAHIDPTVEADYAQLRSDTGGVMIGTFKLGAPQTLEHMDWESPETNVVEASMRQIAHEVIRALEKHFPAELP